jgi:hypothetical protein
MNLHITKRILPTDTHDEVEISLTIDFRDTSSGATPASSRLFVIQDDTPIPSALGSVKW